MTYKEFIDNILSTRGNRGITDDEYYEVHHIVPKCMGGTDNLNNKIRLYAKEHYEAHRLLALENPNPSPFCEKLYLLFPQLSSYS